MADNQLHPTQDPLLRDIYVAGQEKGSKWDIHCRNGTISSIVPSINNDEHRRPIRFAMPSLCHPHIHLDKCFLLSHPKYSDLEIEKGDFQEALELTSMSVHLTACFGHTPISHSSHRQGKVPIRA